MRSTVTWYVNMPCSDRAAAILGYCAHQPPCLSYCQIGILWAHILLAGPAKQERACAECWRPGEGVRGPWLASGMDHRARLRERPGRGGLIAVAVV